jgi:hypothetical protein
MDLRKAALLRSLSRRTGEEAAAADLGAALSRAATPGAPTTAAATGGARALAPGAGLALSGGGLSSAELLSLLRAAASEHGGMAEALGPPQPVTLAPMPQVPRTGTQVMSGLLPTAMIVAASSHGTPASHPMTHSCRGKPPAVTTCLLPP